jgi:hypothetical protein
MSQRKSINGYRLLRRTSYVKKYTPVMGPAAKKSGIAAGVGRVYLVAETGADAAGAAAAATGATQVLGVDLVVGAISRCQ